jgi:hypothetical protein
MNFNFLPQKIKEEIKARFGGKIPVSAARMSGNVDGETGEGYMVAFDDQVLFFSRKTGDDGFVRLESPGLFSAKLRKEGFNLFLDTKIGEKPYSLKFSSFEEADLKKVKDIQSSEDDSRAEQTVESPAYGGFDNTAEISEKRVPEHGTGIRHSEENTKPLILLAAAMMFISKSDEVVSKEEDFYITSLLNYNREVLLKGLNYFKTHSFEELVNDSSALNEIQRLCILSNMLEIAMRDGSFSGKEQKMINSFVTHLGIDNSQSETIKEVLLIKNKISVLDS